MIKFSDLPEQQVQEICEAFAKRDGSWRDDIPVMRHYYGGHDQQIGVRSTRPSELSDYPNDKNAMGRIFKTMDRKQGQTFIYILGEGIHGRPEVEWRESEIFNMFLSECSELFIAAALALGLLKESDK